MIALAIIASIYFGFFGTGWQVTGEMTRWGGEFLELFGLDTSKYSYYKMTISQAVRLLAMKDLCL